MFRDDNDERRRICPNCVIIGPTGPTDTYKSVSEYF